MSEWYGKISENKVACSWNILPYHTLTNVISTILYIHSVGSQHNKEVMSAIVAEIINDPENDYSEEVVKYKYIINWKYISYIYIYIIL